MWNVCMNLQTWNLDLIRQSYCVILTSFSAKNIMLPSHHSNNLLNSQYVCAFDWTWIVPFISSPCWSLVDTRIVIGVPWCHKWAMAITPASYIPWSHGLLIKILKNVCLRKIWNTKDQIFNSNNSLSPLMNAHVASNLLTQISSTFPSDFPWSFVKNYR